MIIDAFPFNDELLLLELRLEELYPVVDKFVIIETRRNYRGVPKPLYFAENKQRYARFLDKIIHHVPEGLPNAGAWEYEILQRNVLADVLRNLSPKLDDTMSFSDCDEVPNPRVVKEYRPELGLRNLKQYTFYYNFNNLMDYGNRSWSRARIGRVEDIYNLTAYEFRQGPRDLDPTFPSIEEGGWHGSYFGDLARIRRKVHSISHDDMDHLVDNASDAEIARRVDKGEDLFHRSGIGAGRYIDTQDSMLPESFRNNVSKYVEFTNAYWRLQNRELLK